MNEIQNIYKMAGDIEEYLRDKLEVRITVEEIDKAITKLYGCNSSRIRKARNILVRAYCNN